MSRSTTVLAAAAGATFALSGSAAAAVQVSQSGWAWGNPQPQGNTIRAMDFAAGRGFAVGDAGTALRTDDGGATWSGLATGTALGLDRAAGRLARRRDHPGRRRLRRAPHRRRRTHVPTHLRARRARLPGSRAGRVVHRRETGYLVLRNGNVLRTSDGGETFERRTAIPGTPAREDNRGQAVPADVVFTDADTGVVFLGGDSVAYRTTDRGQSWNRVDADPATSGACTASTPRRSWRWARTRSCARRTAA